MPRPPTPATRELGNLALGLVLAATAAAAFLGALVLSDDPDMFHHLAMGRQIVRAGFPKTEPFLFPFQGSPLGAPPYWLGSVLIYASHALLGEPGLSLLPALVGALLAVVLVVDATPRGRRHDWLTLCAAAPPIMLALETYRYRAVARTEIFSVVLVALTMWAIRRHEEGRPRALLALPLVAVLWTNLHPGTAAGLVPLAIFVVSGAGERLIRRALGRSSDGAPSWRAIATAAVVLVAVVAASALTPAGGNPVTEAVSFALAGLGIGVGQVGSANQGHAQLVAFVGEMHGGGTALFRTPVGVLVLLAAASFAMRFPKINPREALTVAAFAVLPFHAVRFAVLFAVVAAPIIARNLAATTLSLPPHRGRFPVKIAAAAIFAAGALATLPLGRLAPHIRFGAGLTRGAFPVRGTEFLKALGDAGRVFNTFQFGGYLEWAGISPFQDGRGSTHAADTEAARAGPTQRWSFAQLDARYRFDALVVDYPAGNPRSGVAYGVFDPDPALWSLVAFDDKALLYLRRDGRHAGAASRFAFLHVAPAAPTLMLPPADPAAALREFQRSVDEAPYCWRCRYWLSEVALVAGRPEVCLAAVAPVLRQAHGEERTVFETLAARARAQSREPGGATRPRGSSTGAPR